MKLTCTWSPEQVSNFVTFLWFFWLFPLLPRVPRIDSVQNRLTEARDRREAWRCQSRLTDLWFIIDLLGNATIGNYHVGKLGRQKKKNTGQRAESAARPPGNVPVLPMASLRQYISIGMEEKSFKKRIKIQKNIYTHTQSTYLIWAFIPI